MQGLVFMRNGKVDSIKDRVEMVRQVIASGKAPWKLIVDYYRSYQNESGIFVCRILEQKAREEKMETEWASNLRESLVIA